MPGRRPMARSSRATGARRSRPATSRSDSATSVRSSRPTSERPRFRLRPSQRADDEEELRVSMETAGSGDGGPIVLIGYAGAVLSTLSKLFPDGSLIFVEEPDVVRKRDVRAATAGSSTMRELIE